MVGPKGGASHRAPPKYAVPLFCLPAVTIQLIAISYLSHEAAAAAAAATDNDDDNVHNNYY